ncbi:hypothetical protein BDZ91DRAFT_739577 [Kalaharituber pfeilii]|nr:hypothetical protein BDZ91DRAFT_739577 [Kalaharituber pfeilii]
MPGSAPDMMWYCCDCLKKDDRPRYAGPNLCHTEKCTECDHERCKNCSTELVPPENDTVPV